MKHFVIKVAMHALGDTVMEGYFDPIGELTENIDAALKLTPEELPKRLQSINWDGTIRAEIESIVDET